MRKNSICASSFKDLYNLWKPHKIVNWHLQSRRPQSCHVRFRAGHRRHPLGHLWRKGRPARGPLVPLSVWTTALWAGHGLGVGHHAHIHTTAAATATRRPRRARHWPAWPGKQSSKEDKRGHENTFTAVYCTGQGQTLVSFRLMMQILFDLILRIHITFCDKYDIDLIQESKALNLLWVGGE